jgi:lipid-binding SYLF domain-containing protein
LSAAAIPLGARKRLPSSIKVDAAMAKLFAESAASFGLQAGGQKFSCAMFFMTDGALEYLKKSDG